MNPLLGIIDPKEHTLNFEGFKPLKDSDKNCIIAFQGNIYNAQHLRSECESKGAVFQSDSPEELIIKAYRQWGLDCLSKLNGSWAFILHDLNSNQFIVSRDRLGLSQLYWSKYKGIFYFSSNIKGLLAIPCIRHKRAVNENAIYPFIVYNRRSINNETFFKDIYAFPPASFSVVDKEFPKKIIRFWQIPDKRLSPKDVPADEAAKKLRDLTFDSMLRRFPNDGTVGFELSGGLDSSIVVTMAKELSEDQLSTYTVRFPEENLNENSYAESVARMCQTQHHTIEPDLDDFWDQLESFTLLMEEPYHAPNYYVKMKIMNQIKDDGFKIDFGGGGPDELFAGYRNHFLPFQIENLACGRFGTYFHNNMHWTRSNKRMQLLTEPLARFLRLNNKHYLPEVWHNFKRAEKEDFIQVEPHLKKLDYSIQLLSQILKTDMINDRIPYYVGSSGVPYWLSAGNNVSVGAAIEARSPFRDYRIIDYAFSMPITYLIHDGWQKWILRKAFEELLPEEVVWRRDKSGLQFPFKRCFMPDQDKLERIEKYSDNPYIDFSSFKNYLQLCAKDGYKDWDTNTIIWRTLTFIFWYELFINENKAFFTKIN